mgnify:FL=1
MKKTKLLSTISTLTLGASVAAFAASCSTTPPTPSIGELSIDATEVSLGGKTSLTTGDTLSNDLMVGDKATYVIKSTSKYSNVSWTLSEDTKT